MAHSNARDLVITHVKGEGILLKFWALPANALDVIKNLEKQFSRKADELESTSGFLRNHQTPVGFKCVVKSKIKVGWCRAVVKATVRISEILVQLMDYGSEETISVADARKVDEQIFHFAPQAIECILADVVPNGPEWSPEAVRFCEQQLLFQTLSCFIVNHYMKIPIVRIAKKGETEPFVQRLINSGLAYIKTEPHPSSKPYKINRLDQGTLHLVKISCVENIRKFYVQLSAVDVELKNLMDNIKIYTSRENLSYVTNPAVNQPCLAKVPSQHCYYRALITSVAQARCKVVFVDYGHTDVQDFQNLRVIPPVFLNLPAQAICCSLSPDINISGEEFMRISEFDDLQCYVLGQTDETYIIKLQRDGRDLFSYPVQPFVPSYMPQKLKVGTKIEVSVSSINDMTEFFCQLSHLKDQLNIISGALNSGCEFIPISLKECLPNAPVCVKFSEDNLWYRAHVVKVNHENDIEVFFVDYGNYDNASLRDVRRIRPELFQFPVQAIKCNLFDFQLPSDQSLKDELYDLFEELTNGQNLVAHINGYSDAKYALTLYEKNSGLSINEKLESKILTVDTVPVSEVENLYITHFESPDSFFGQFERLNSNKLSEMQEAINSFYINSRNTTFIPKVGNLVCARFQDDGQFYRAIVENFTGTVYEVFFIDYGNKEHVVRHDIHPINKKFTKWPQFGIQCAFQNCPSGVPVDKLSSLLLENQIQAKMIREVHHKWYIVLTEDFSGNVAILEFIRQHETVVPRSIHGAGLAGFQERKLSAESSPTPVKIFPKSISNFHANVRAGPEKACNFDSTATNRNEVFSACYESKFKEKASQEFDEYDTIAIPPKACRNVFVSHVVSPSEFYCQIEEDSPKLERLMKNIEDIYMTIGNNDLNFSEFIIDAPCCALFQDDGAWYRGKIKRVISKSCDINFVDYGNTDSVPLSKVKVLKSELLSLPSQAICCKSFNVSPKEGVWSDDDVDTFVNMTLEKSFVAQFVECDNNGTYAVNLVSIGKLQDDILNKEFVSLGHGRLEDSSKMLVMNSPAVSSNLAFTSSEVSVGSVVPVKVTYGLNPGEVFCQLKLYEKEFKEMMVKLQDCYNKISADEAMIDRPHPGMICVAQFYLDSAWYRAEINKVERNTICVFYVDYGNSETVDRKQIRFITQDFTLLPTQAIKCRIRGINPPGKSWQINDKLGQYFDGDTECNFLSKTGDHFLVDIMCNKANIALSLIKDGLAVSDGTIAYEKPTIPLQNVSKALKYKTDASLPKREHSFVSGQLLSVIVSYIESPSRFWCQLTDESDILEQLMADIEAQYSECNISPDKSPSFQVGSYCIAQYSLDGAWYRAQVQFCDSNNKYKVFFIDYGNSEVVSLSEIASISPQFLQFPPQCFECQLLHAPSSESDKIETFQELVNEAEELIAKVEDVNSAVCIVSLLYDKENDQVNINEVLFGSSEESYGFVTHVPVLFLPPDVPLGLQEGYVTIVNTPQDFFIQLASAEDALAELSTEVSQNCECGNGVVAADPYIGYACCAMYSEDGNWYRAEVISIQESTVGVLFIDYGNVDTVNKDALKPLSEKLLQIPPYAIKCKMNGIIPVTEQWSEDAVNIFQEMVSDSLLGITFISKDIPAIVNISKDDKDVAQHLVDMELANVDTCAETGEVYAEDHLTAPLEDQPSSLPSDQSYPERKLNSTKLAVKICYVDTYDKFYVMPLELSTELDTVMNTLELLYAPETEENEKSSLHDILEDPKPFMPCVTKYSEDEALYRAFITDVDGENIYVKFVDYGNSEVTSIQNVKSLAPELVKIPPIAIECSLYGIEAYEGKEQEITAKLEEYFVDEIELEMEICEVSPNKVKLYYNGDFTSMLIKEGFAKEVGSMPENLPVEMFTDNSQLAFVEESSEELKSVIPLRFVSGVEEIKGIVKFCEIEDCLIVLYVVSNDLEKELDELQEELQTTYNNSGDKLINIKCMDFCVAKYVQDENWYRAQILSCDNDKIKVKFIDFGNTEIVEGTDVCQLKPSFSAKPQFCIRYAMSGLKIIENQKDELQNLLDEYLYVDSVILKLCKSCQNTNAYCITNVICGDADLFEIIISKHFVHQQYIMYTQFEDQFEALIEKTDGNTYYMLPLKLQEKRDNFQSELQETFSAVQNTVSEVNMNRLYAAKLKSHWSRVSVVLCNDDTINVNFVDFGNILEVKMSDLVPLPLDLSHQPLFLQPCLISFEGMSAEMKAKVIENVSVGSVVECEVQKPLVENYPLVIRLCSFSSSAVSEIIAENHFLCSEETVSLPNELTSDIPDNVSKNESSADIEYLGADNKKNLQDHAAIEESDQCNDYQDETITFSTEKSCDEGIPNETSLEVKEEHEVFEYKDESTDIYTEQIAFNAADEECVENNAETEKGSNQSYNYEVENNTEFSKTEDFSCEFTESMSVPEVMTTNENLETKVEGTNIYSEQAAASSSEMKSRVQEDESANIYSEQICTPYLEAETRIQKDESADSYNEQAASCSESESNIQKDESADIYNEQAASCSEEESRAQEDEYADIYSEQAAFCYEVESTAQENKKADVYNDQEASCSEAESRAQEDEYADSYIDQAASCSEVESNTQNDESADIYNEQAASCSEAESRAQEDEYADSYSEQAAFCSDAESRAQEDEYADSYSEQAAFCSEAESTAQENKNSDSYSEQAAFCYEAESTAQENKNADIYNEQATSCSHAESRAQEDENTDSYSEQVTSSDTEKGTQVTENFAIDDLTNVDDSVSSIKELDIKEQNADACINSDKEVVSEGIKTDLVTDSVSSMRGDDIEKYCDATDDVSKNICVEMKLDQDKLPVSLKESAEKEYSDLLTEEKASDYHTIPGDTDGLYEEQIPENVSHHISDTENSNLDNMCLSNDSDPDGFKVQDICSHFDENLANQILECESHDVRSHCLTPQELADNECIENEVCDKNNYQSVSSLERENVFDSSHMYQLSGTVDVIVSDVAISEGSIILAVTPQHLVEKLSDFQNSLQVVYPSKTDQFAENTETNLCAVLSDGAWSRAKILEMKDDEMTVVLIDFGKGKHVNASNAKNLELEHLSTPPFAIWCTLASAFCLPDKENFVKEHLQSLLEGKNVTIKIIDADEPYKISMLVNNSDVLDEMLEKKMIVQKLLSSYFRPGKYKAKQSFLNVDSNKFELYVNLCSHLNDMIKVTEHMQKSYNFDGTCNPPIIESGFYAVHHNNSWFRGMVISSDPELHIDLVDTGEKLYDCSTLSTLLPEHYVYPPYAIKCEVPCLKIPIPNIVLDNLQDVFTAHEFLIDISNDNNIAKATLVDPIIMSKLQELNLCDEENQSDDSKKSEYSENAKSIESEAISVDKVATCTISEKQELSEQFVSFLNESFSADAT